MKPIIILPPDTMTDEQIELLRQNDLCVVVASDPSKVRFVDPIPAVSSRTQMEDAAIRLSRRILSKQWLPDDKCTYSITRGEIARMYVDILAKGTPLDPEETFKEERYQQIFDNAKADELRNLAREEARAERAAKKKAEAKK